MSEYRMYSASEPLQENGERISCAAPEEDFAPEIPPRKQKEKKHKKYRDGVSGFLMAIPPVIGFFLFAFIPQLVSLWLSFQEAHSFDFTLTTFVGFRNFKEVLTSSEFWLSVGNTVFYMIPRLLCILLGLAIAVLLSHKGIRGKKFFRSVFFIPYVCSVVATTVMWYWIFEEDYGILNGILEAVSGADARMHWLSTEWPFRFTLVFMLTWSGCGYSIILYQSAIAAVDVTLYEAADMDGANAWQKFIHITWPAIMPTTFFMFIMGLINGLQAFTTQQVWGDQVGGQGPNQSALTAVYFIYRKAWVQPSTYGMGYASAASWILAVLIGIVTVVNFKVKGRRDDK